MLQKLGISACKTIQDKSQEFRWLEREGRLILQVACLFQCGSNGGIEWRDIPVVKENDAK